VRSSIAITFCFLATSVLAADQPDDLLQRGRAEYAAGSFAQSAKDLGAAVDAYLAPAQVQAYVNSGKFPSLPNLETALVYLTLADHKAGRDADAREALRQLQVAERIEPTYARLPLTNDVAEFESVAQTLTPDLPLPPNQSLASLRSGGPGLTQIAPAPTAEEQRAAMMRELERRIAEVKAEAEKKIEEQVAAARVAADKEVQERVAQERAAIEKDAQARIAAARAAAQTHADEEVAAATTPPKPRPTVTTKAKRRPPTEQLRQAEAAAANGKMSAANEIYVRFLNARDVPRMTMADVAVGLYRTGDYADAVRAFARLGPFRRGEEDLRYYDAVSLFETGHYDQAREQLECALPYIESNEDVQRYRTKIEEMTGREAMR